MLSVKKFQHHNQKKYLSMAKKQKAHGVTGIINII